MINPQPQSEHEWLQQLVGEWTFEAESSMCADRPTIKTTGTECVRSLGGLWTIGEGQGGRSADAGRTARHDRDRAFEISHGCLLGRTEPRPAR